MREADILRATMTDSGTFTRRSWTGSAWQEETVYQYLPCALSKGDQTLMPRTGGQWEDMVECQSRMGLFLPADTALQAGDRAEIVRQGQVFRGVCGPSMPYLSHCYATILVQEVARA